MALPAAAPGPVDERVEVAVAAIDEALRLLRHARSHLFEQAAIGSPNSDARWAFKVRLRNALAELNRALNALSPISTNAAS